jgi:hypothetical protein
MATRRIQQKRTYKPQKIAIGVDVGAGKDMTAEEPFRANNGVWKPMNSENGLCDTKILRRGLDVQG